MNEKNKLGDRLRMLRKTKEIKQVELAANMSVAPGTVSKYESGERRPDVNFLKKLRALTGNNRLGGDDFTSWGVFKLPAHFYPG